MAARPRVQKPQASSVVAAALEQEARLVEIGEELLRAGAQVEDWVELKQLALEKLRERDGGG